MISRRLLRIKALQVLYASLQKEDEDLKKSFRELDKSIDNSFKLYYEMLCLISEVGDYAEERIEMALNKKLPSHDDLHPSRRFVDNSVFEALNRSAHFKNYQPKRIIHWNEERTLLKDIWQAFSTSEEYKDYMQAPKSSLPADIGIIRYLISMHIADNPKIEAVLEEQNIYWNDDLSFILQIILKSIERIKEGKQKDIVLDRVYDTEADESFIKRIIEKAYLNKDSLQALIEKHSDNWDIERIAFMDKLIMQLAIAEFIYLPDIPIKVTINEYIEISKYYSTSRSKTFVNGVLDRIVHELNEQGKIRKEGRGLVGGL